MFKDIGLRDEIIQAIDDLGYKTPTEIQKQAIKHILNSSKDLIAKAVTGSGKTAAFALPIIQNIDTSFPKTQCLVLCPTRELALQIYDEIIKFTKYMPRVKSLVVYGGVSIVPQIEELRQSVHIVVGTPGRVLDLMDRKKLKVTKARYLVLDEADKMLGMGFKEDIEKILSKIHLGRQSLLFSATIPGAIKDLVRRYLNNPTKISIEANNDLKLNIKHSYFVGDLREKILILKYLLLLKSNAYGIVFCRTKLKAKDLAFKLKSLVNGIGALQGDMSQNRRDEVMKKFKNKDINILIATDVAARGIDVDDLNLVINYDLPDDREGYLHRTGRTGRAGRSGEAISLICEKERKIVKKYEEYLNVEFTEVYVGNKQPKENSKPKIIKKEIVKKEVIPINPNSRFFINLGSKNELAKEDLEKTILKLMNKKSLSIKNIEIMKTFSFFEVNNKFKDEIITKLNKKLYNDIMIKVEVAKDKKKK